MGTGFAKKKKQAKMFQEQMQKMQEELLNKEIEGTAGGGLVKLTLNGNHELLSLTINPECVDPEDIEGLQDLIKAAHKDATDKLSAQSSQGMPSLPFGGF